MNKTIDLNCDMGEGMPNDEAIMPYISSANIACGFHAGDKDTMKRTIELCLRFKVAIGAHPSFLDRENFGRSDMMQKGVQLKEIPNLIAEQVYAFKNICDEMGASIHHVKPHGALYNRAVWDKELAETICASVYNVDKLFKFYGLAHGHMKDAALNLGLTYVAEAFADRTYQEDGSLTPRSQTFALIENPHQALAQAIQMVQNKMVPTVSGKSIFIDAQTLCLHGDGLHATSFAKNIYKHLKQNNIDIQASEKVRG